MNETVSGMNGKLWTFAVLLIGMVIVQALLFLRATLKFNKKNNLATRDELRSAFRMGTVSVFGPSLSSIAVALSLIAMVGSAVTFMRCGVIGAPPWELIMADISAQAVGVQFNTAEFTSSVFVLCIFGMTFASAPYFINTIITLKPLDAMVAKNKASGGDKESFIPSLGNAAMTGILGYMLLDYLKTPAQVTAVLSSGIMSYLIIRVIARTGVKWLRDWNMAFSMIVGMTAGQIIAAMAA